MKFTSHAKTNDIEIKVGDVFEDKSGCKFLIVRPIVEVFKNHFESEGYTFMNLTSNKLIHPNVFSTLDELKDYILNMGVKRLYDGDSVELNLGVPVYSSV